MTRALLTLAVGTTMLMATVSAELSAPVKALVDAERAFSAAAASKGQRDAFLEYLADDSLLFRPGPVPGKMFYRTRPVPPGALSWAPVFADVSADGDMGLSTGPYEFRKDGSKPTDPAAGFGHFVSIWRKQKDGAWRVEVDLGTSHDKYTKAVADVTAADVETLKTVPKPPAAKAEQNLQQSLTDAEKEFAKAAATEGYMKAYRTVAMEDVRILRNGQLPVIGKKLLDKALAGAPGPTAPAAAAAPAAKEPAAKEPAAKDPAAKNPAAKNPAANDAPAAAAGSGSATPGFVPAWEPVHTRVASSGDFGYTTGAINSPGAAASPMGGGSAPQRQYYLHVWRRDASGAWKLLLDVVP